MGTGMGSTVAAEPISEDATEGRPPGVTEYRVLLVDDHEVVRAGLKTLVDSEDDMTVVGEAGSVEEAVRRVAFEEPDVVVLDVRLPDGSGIDACREIRARFSGVRVLMLTSFADEEALMAAVLAGASGYVLKRVKNSALINSIRRVGSGEILLDAETIEGVVERLRHGWVDDPLLALLTTQERTIVEHIAAGLTNRQIAEKMFLAEKTVKNYVSNILAKMGMNRRTEAAAYMARVEAEKNSPLPSESWD